MKSSYSPCVSRTFLIPSDPGVPPLPSQPDDSNSAEIRHLLTSDRAALREIAAGLDRVEKETGYGAALALSSKTLALILLRTGWRPMRDSWPLEARRA